MKNIFYAFVLLVTSPAFTQSSVTKDIKWFGAKGNGKTNDHDAFMKAADFFTKRGGNGTLIISKGTYLVGKQQYNKNTTGAAVYQGFDLLHFSGCKNLAIKAIAGSVIKYKDSLRFGAFDPATGKAYQHGATYFVNYAYVASIGSAIYFENCSAIQINNVVLNGNSPAHIYGGVYGDVGIQIPHIGLQIKNCKDVTVAGLKADYFGLDGAIVMNDTTRGNIPDKITFRDCSFEYNNRQGLSWTGGNDLTVINCNFNHTGQSGHVSPPAAGVDIEAEVGPVRNGKFVNCNFINNTGCGLVADSGPSADCSFTGCTFWGITTWSAWVTKPGFTFTASKFYGSFVHGFNAATDKEATKFFSCDFEDKPYKGKEPYGNFLIESNSIRRLRFENCTMLAHKKKVVWMESSPAWVPEEKYQLINCRLQYDGNNFPANEWISLTRNIRFANTTFELKHPEAKKKNYWFNGVDAPYNVNLGGSRFVTGKEISPF